MMKSKLPTYFLSHGGGPWPYMQGEFRSHFDLLEASLVDIQRQLGGTPVRAVLVVTGHWETAQFAVSSGAHPGMIYDFGGFPEETYHAKYPAPGAPLLAQQVADCLNAAGITTVLDPQRGFDHGTYSMLQPMYPKADVPVVQLSLRRDFDPAIHIEVGGQLAFLREQGVLIVGSGLSYHNLSRFRAGAEQPSDTFDLWLQESLALSDPNARIERLLNWERAPAARLAHPREDHLMPLHVVVGASGSDAMHCFYHEQRFMGHVCVSSFRFGDALTADGK